MPNTARPRLALYVASTLGLSEAGRDFYYSRLLPLLESSGFVVLDPWRLTNVERIERVRTMPFGAGRRDAWRQLNMEIGETNRRAIENADGMLAVIDGNVGGASARRSGSATLGGSGSWDTEVILGRPATMKARSLVYRSSTSLRPAVGPS